MARHILMITRKRSLRATLLACVLSAAAGAAASALPITLPASSTTNQINTALGLNTAVSGGAKLTGGFATVSGLSGAALQNALTQISGSATVDLGVATSLGGSSLVDILASGGVIAPGLSGTITLSSPTSPLGALPWAVGLAGHSDISGSTTSGAAGLSSGSAGIALGVEKDLGDNTAMGLSLGLDHQSLSAGAGGSAHSNDVTLGVYGRHSFSDPFYIAAALAYGWHDIESRRVVTVSGTDMLAAGFSATDLSGRLELGYRFDLGGGMAVAPFAAFSADSFSTPAYQERAVSGSPSFALSYAPLTTDNQHFEAGLHFGDDLAMTPGRLSLTADVAWAHQLTGPAQAQVSFQALPGSNFLVNGLQPVSDSALLGVGLHMTSSENLSYGIGVQGQVGGGTSAVAGTLSLLWQF